MHNLTPDHADRARRAVAEHAAESFRHAGQALQDFAERAPLDPLAALDARAATAEATETLATLDALGWPDG